MTHDQVKGNKDLMKIMKVSDFGKKLSQDAISKEYNILDQLYSQKHVGE